MLDDDLVLVAGNARFTPLGRVEAFVAELEASTRWANAEGQAALSDLLGLELTTLAGRRPRTTP